MKEIKGKPLTEPCKIAIVTSRFNEKITQPLYEGTVERLKELNVAPENITSVWVPGAVEIPVTAQHLAFTDEYVAVIALGAVIRGETTHYDYVCQQVSYGCQKVSLESEVPVIFGILTTENSEQAFDRLGGAHGHKGHDCAEAAVEMVSVLQQIVMHGPLALVED